MTPPPPLGTLFHSYFSVVHLLSQILYCKVKKWVVGCIGSRLMLRLNLKLNSNTSWSKNSNKVDFHIETEYCKKRAERFCSLRGNRLLFGFALTAFCSVDSARPLNGCLDMNIMCWRQCSDQSEARIP